MAGSGALMARFRRLNPNDIEDSATDLIAEADLVRLEQGDVAAVAEAASRVLPQGAAEPSGAELPDEAIAAALPGTARAMTAGGTDVMDIDGLRRQAAAAARPAAPAAEDGPVIEVGYEDGPLMEQTRRMRMGAPGAPALPFKPGGAIAPARLDSPGQLSVRRPDPLVDDAPLGPDDTHTKLNWEGPRKQQALPFAVPGETGGAEPQKARARSDSNIDPKDLPSFHVTMAEGDGEAAGPTSQSGRGTALAVLGLLLAMVLGFAAVWLLMS